MGGTSAWPGYNISMNSQDKTNAKPRTAPTPHSIDNALHVYTLSVDVNGKNLYFVHNAKNAKTLGWSPNRANAHQFSCPVTVWNLARKYGASIQTVTLG